MVENKKILNFGSLNLDFVYKVEHFVCEGETTSALSRQEFCGGKGLNQSIALSRAGANVFHMGSVGVDGEALVEKLRKNNVDVTCVRTSEQPTGHAIIQVDTQGKNCILIYGGANRFITEAQIDKCLKRFTRGDILLLQNETNCRDYMINAAHQMGMYVVLNPSPIDRDLIQSRAISNVDMLILNEVEGYQITQKHQPSEICMKLREMFPNCSVVLTLGSQGVVYYSQDVFLSQEAFKVNDVVDTTAAGDTFTGYFLASMLRGESVSCALKIACKASAVAVTRSGASDSIPYINEIV